ncbi:MAG: outer membrane protein assembly factor BamB family protein [Pirellulales bacterium]
MLAGSLQPWRIIAIGTVLWMIGSGTIPAAEPASGDARAIAKRIGVQRGLCVILGEQGGTLALDLARASELTLYVELPDAAGVARLRKAADAAGLLGTRIYVEQGDGRRIHLADNLADAVLAGAPDGAANQAELLRVLHPGGKALLGSAELVKPAPAGLDDWSHPYHGPDNNPQSQDQLARAPYLTQFLAEPWYTPMPQVTVTSAGRVFKAFGHIAFKEREWPWLNKLVAMNGYNGAMLWQRDLKPGFMIHRNTMIATPETLYLADDDSCKLIDAATGKLKDEIVLTADTSTGPTWKWMALEGGVLYVLAGEREPANETLRGTSRSPGWPWDGLGKGYAQRDYPWGFGQTFLAVDPATKKVLWRRDEAKPIDSRATCMRNGRIYYYSHGEFLACLDARTGRPAWKTSNPALLEAIGIHDPAQTYIRGYTSQVYLAANDEALYFAGPQRRRLVAASTKDGSLLWQYGKDGNFELVLRDGAVYAMGKTDSSKKFEPLTGKILADLGCLRGNCTRATGTVDSVFSRGDNHGGTLRLALAANDDARRIGLMRPGCHDGVIASNGLLYWGPWMCDCNLSLVGVIALGPAGAFDFASPAKESERLETLASDPARIAPFPESVDDWPTYRADNLRNGATRVSIAGRVSQRWQFTPTAAGEPTAPVAVGELIFVSGSDGAVRALDAATGKPRWTAYTGGPVRYSPAIWKGRVYVGSGDGWVYAFEAATGRTLWRFRAAPAERKIPIYGSLCSTWPVASGVLVEDGVVYAAAGLASYDGTHVYALDAVTGKIRWQNNTSGRLINENLVSGISVQGHLLLHAGKLYLAGGNVVSPAVYDAADGKCLNTLTDQWQKAPRGKELYLIDGKVTAFDQLLYAPKEYQSCRYFSGYFVQAASGDTVVRGNENLVARIALKDDAVPAPAERARAALNRQASSLWDNKTFTRPASLALAKNAVLVAGPQRGKTPGEAAASVLAALDPAGGKMLWSQPLPASPVLSGLAVDRAGRMVVALEDGRVVCFGAEQAQRR